LRTIPSIALCTAAKLLAGLPGKEESLLAGFLAFAFTRMGELLVMQRDLDLLLLETCELCDQNELAFVMIDINRGIPTTPRSGGIEKKWPKIDSYKSHFCPLCKSSRHDGADGAETEDFTRGGVSDPACLRPFLNQLQDTPTIQASEF
jgi:hypothetical protein